MAANQVLTGETIAEIRRQATQLHEQHESLQLRVLLGRLELAGMVGFRCDVDGLEVEDEFHITIDFPDPFPQLPPRAFETGGRIPASFEHFLADGSLCLEATIEVRRKWAADPTLVGFVNNLVVPYLAFYSFKEQYGHPPSFGDRPHGARGLSSYYMDYFQADFVSTLKLLQCLAEDAFPPRGKPCPCGSKKKLKRCHGPALSELRPLYTPQEFAKELIAIYGSTPPAMRYLLYTLIAQGDLRLDQIARIADGSNRKTLVAWTYC